MTVYKSIPMSPAALPQQRLYLVPDMGSTPQNLTFSIGEPGQNRIPSKIPQSAAPIAQVEWAWSPMNNRIDSYHISLDSKRSRWVFWHSCFDDSGYHWHWEVISATSTPRAGVSKKQAAIALLEHFWREEVEDVNLDHYHWINDSDFLSVGELAQIARNVWKPRSSPTNETTEQSDDAVYQGQEE